MKPTIQPARGNRPCRPGPSAAGRLLGKVVLAIVLLCGTVSGCAAAPELNGDAARELQLQVLTVTEAAAANDPAAALRQLDGLVQKLDEAAGRGEVSFQRHQSIRKSIDTVRTDLNAQQAAAETARVAAEQEAAAQAQAAAQAAAAAAQAQAAASAPAPAVAPAAPAEPPADTGKAKGKGKGKD